MHYIAKNSMSPWSAGTMARPVNLASPRGFYPLLSGAHLGATGQEWYDRARTAVTRFDQLLATAKAIPVKSEREQILAWIGQVGSVDTPMERYLTVVENIHYVESFDPIDYSKYDVARLQHRVEKLEAFDGELEKKIAASRLLTGAPGGTSPTQPGGVKPPGTAGGMDLTIPLIAAGAAVVLAVVLSA
jgi:hypothetical protein